MKHVVLALTLVATSALGQKMLATYSTLTTAAAQRAAQAALDKCTKEGYRVAVAVVDRGGQPLVVLRDNLAGSHTVNTAIGKASSRPWTPARSRSWARCKPSSRTSMRPGTGWFTACMGRRLNAGG